MRGASGVAYLASLALLIILDLLGVGLGLWVLVATAAALWLALDIRALAHRTGEHLLEATTYIEIGVLGVLAVTRFGLGETPLLLAGLASLVHGVGFIEARSLGALAQTTGMLEVVAGACFLVGLGQVSIALAVPATLLKIALLRSPAARGEPALRAGVAHPHKQGS